MGNIKNRGFASMSVEARRKIASLGGKAVSSNKEHMAAIGQLGGERSGASRRQARLAAIEENEKSIIS